MKKNLLSSIALAVTAMLGVASAATITVTVKDDGVSNIGAPGTFYWALTNCSPGDNIAFNISGPGPHFLQVPPGGFPLLYQKHGVTIDGYTQPGALANTNPNTAANNAQLKIVIDGRNGNGRDMDYSHYDGTPARSVPPIDNTPMATEPNATGPGDWAMLGIYRSTNVTIKGLAFLADNIQDYANGIAFLSGIFVAHDYGLDTTIKDALEYPAGDSRGCHVAGCWFGVNPTNVTKSGVVLCANWINFPRHQGDDGPTPAGDATRRPQLPNVGVTIGVAPGSANPRAEFNVIVGGAYHVGGEPLRMRISGNFIGVMPDGVTPYDMSTENGFTTYVFGLIGSTVEFGRFGENYASSATQGQPMIFGTDGDGVNDADEGNLWGPIGGMVGKASLTTRRPTLIHYYRSGNNIFLISGNRWGIGNDGQRWANSAFLMSSLYLDDSGDGKTKLIIGSDFASSRSAATIVAQANHFYNNWPISAFGNPPATDAGIVPFLNYENPNPTSASATTSSNAWVSLRGNVMVGNGLSPVTYADGIGDLLTGFTNFFSSYLDTNFAIIPSVNAGSVFPNLAGTFAPGIAPFTNVIIDVYQLDPEGWANGQLFNLTELMNLDGTTNGFPQGKKYIGSFPVANTGSFNITLPALADVGLGQVTVTANYSQDPAGTALGRTATSDFANPVYVLPAGVASVGLTHVVTDVANWYDAVNNYVTNGPINLANQAFGATLGNWEPYISSLGDSTFLIEFNTFANDGTGANQNNAVAKQPAAGGSAKVGYCFYADNGTPFKGALNLSRQNGNPGRVAGDLRYGANKFITEAEVSLGQLPEFQTVVPARWLNNDIYTGNNRYAAEQIFSLDPLTLTQTPVTNAWDYVYGNFVGVMGVGNNAPQVGRTGGRPNFLDNGNIVVMTDDKSAILSPVGEVITFAIIQPNGTIVKGPTLAKETGIFDNMCAVKGGFVIRATDSLLFYNNSGTLMYSNTVIESSGMTFSDGNGRGDNMRINGDIRSYYVYAAGALSPGNHEAGVAVWDTRTGQFVASAIASDGDPAVQLVDRCGLSVDALDRVCVAYTVQPDANYSQQVAARVAQFDGTKFNWLTHSFFPFVNHDEDPANVLGYKTTNPYVAMNTRQICIAAKGTINSTNSATAGPDSLPEQTVYTVISHPAPVAAPQPTLTLTKTGGNLNLSWNPEDGLFTVQTRSSLTTGSWANATVGNVATPVTVSAGAGPLFVRLVR